MIEISKIAAKSGQSVEQVLSAFRRASTTVTAPKAKKCGEGPTVQVVSPKDHRAFTKAAAHRK